MPNKYVLDFLTEIEQNNNREWFASNKHRYDTIFKEMKNLAGEWIEGVKAFDPDVADNDPNKAVFRIYKDVRFSADKRPYKNNIGMAIGRGGRTAKWAGYYLHIQPGESFIAGGKWMPDSQELKAIRQEIDYNYSQLQAIVHDSAFQETFGDLDTEYQLKKNPRDYAADHPAIEWLKLKSFTVSRRIPDEEVLSADLMKNVIAYSKAMHPFLRFLNEAMADVGQ